MTFKLRSDVKFHDGSPLSAEAVVFTFQRFKEKGSRSPIYSGISQISKVEAVDGRTVRFSFDKPSTTFFGTISMPYSGIIEPGGREGGRRLCP